MKLNNIITAIFLIVFTTAISQEKPGPVPQEAIYKIIDGDTLKLQLYQPQNFKDDENYPAIVFFFGGGWNGGSITQFKPQAEYFASRGMVTVLVDYRVKNRHGTTPFEAVNDAKSAIRFLRIHTKDYHIDPNKIVVSGGSAGGHLAAATTLLPGLNEEGEDLSISTKANALILYNPVIDNGPDGYGYERVKERYKEISPIHNIEKGAPPTLFLLGSEDALIPVSTAYEFKDRMQAVGSQCEVIIYEGQPHGFFNDFKSIEHYKKTTLAADKFLQSLGYLEGEATCCGQKEVVNLLVTKEDISEDTNNTTFNRLEAAIARARELRKNDPEIEIDIELQAGDYHLAEPIVIPAELSGISIRGSDASEVSIKGSIPLKPEWRKHNKNIYVTEVDGNLDFDQLIIAGKAQILARYPNYDENGHYWQGHAADAISKERLASWENPKGAFFHALHKGRWGGYHFKITGINDDGTAILEGGHQNNRPSKPHDEYRMVENVFEELDSPGEWFLDKEQHALYYWPSENVDIATSEIEVSALKNLIQVVGTLENPVRNVSISDISFENSRRTFMEDYEPLLRSDWTIYRGAALFFEGTENCTVKNSSFTNLGGNVIMASKYNKGLEIKGNHIFNCGASAVSFIGDPSAVRSPSFNYAEFVSMAEMDTLPGPKNELYPRECLVENNLIHRIGRIEKQTAGVQISMAMDITVRHNSIYDVPRAGINIGDGTWGGHIIEFNDVFNTVLETSDHGSFNSWGRDRFWLPNRRKMDSLTTARPDMYKWDAVKTTIIRNNRFRCDHGWDIDLDDGSSNYHIYNNLLLNSGLKLREGFDRVAENNIMVNNSLHPHVWFANSRDVFRHNIVGDAYQDVGLVGWGKELDYNFFPTEEAMLKSRIYDRDMHSSYGDPMFNDPSTLDFSVAEDSPALEIGFENFPMDKFGVQKPGLKKIAKTPKVPEIKDPSESKGSPVVSWLRNNLKSVDSSQEQSAYGLNSAEGVIVLRTWKPSPAVQNGGIKEGDVILQAGGKKVKDIQDFFRINSENKTDKLDILVMRNQSEKKLTINVK
ncbi:alpha/beta hydrolase fold domain-containing protein [Gramella sp. AN32]|uniref:Alpha/beta hydrolase fold domain-containing protein n=1 Tax=Christiangramia antarctica TaxID=2058158 RepID=A0ABW5X228_9FLAO|nr:alpha/beta hydrolase fold domain-containing protein [Gramella sp. AN32]